MPMSSVSSLHPQRAPQASSSSPMQPRASVAGNLKEPTPPLVGVFLTVFEAVPISCKTPEKIARWKSFIHLALNSFKSERNSHEEVAKRIAFYLSIYFNTQARAAASVFSQVPDHDVLPLAHLRLQNRGSALSSEHLLKEASPRFEYICCFFECTGKRERELSLGKLKTIFESLKPLEQANWVDQITLYLSKTRIHSLTLQIDYILFCYNQKLPLLTPFSALLEAYQTSRHQSPYYPWVKAHFSAYGLGKELALLDKRFCAPPSQDENSPGPGVAEGQSLGTTPPDAICSACAADQLDWLLKQSF